MNNIRKINPVLKILGSFLIMMYEISPFIFFPGILQENRAVFVIIIAILFIGADIFIRPVNEKSVKDKYETWKIYFFFVISPLMLFLPYIESIYISRLYQSSMLLNSLYFIGMLITILGGTLLILSRLIIGRYGTPKLTIQKKHKLITRGPYKIVRNPLSSADLLLYGGFAISFGAWISFAVNIILLLVIIIERIRMEELMLEETFKEEYFLWKSKTWRLIPYIW
ncbi:MAG: isoprenylcysteine carboxylmethyltransferase family protein [bacterium]